MFGGVEQPGVGFVQVEGAGFYPGVEWGPPATGDAFEDQHDFAAGGGVRKVGREDDVNGERFPPGSARQSHGIPGGDSGCGRWGRAWGRGRSGFGSGFPGRGFIGQSFEMMQADGDGMGANDAVFAGGPAGAEVLDIGDAFDDESGAVADFSGLDNALEHRRRPVGGQDFSGAEQGAGVLDGLPTGRLLEERIVQLNLGHRRRLG